MRNLASIFGQHLPLSHPRLEMEQLVGNLQCKLEVTMSDLGHLEIWFSSANSKN